MEDLHGGLQLVGAERNEVGVGAVRQHYRLLFHEFVYRAQIVAQAGSQLELEVLCGLFHSLGQALAYRPGIAIHEAQQLVHCLTVLLSAYPADARRVALADVSQQAGSPQPLVAVVHTLGAGAHREDAGKQVQGLAHGPRMRIRAKVAHPLAPRTPVEECAGN